MIIAKELEWTREYIESVTHLLPHLKNLKRINTRKASKKFIQWCHGVCTKYYNGKNFRITLYTNAMSIKKIKPLNINIVQYSKMEMLMTLAHELAHLEHWNHTPDHKSLECTIGLVFMAKLKAEGYVSEEEEAKLVNGFKIS